MIFGQTFSVIFFWGVIIISIIFVILLVRFFIRRSSRTSKDTGTDTPGKTKMETLFEDGALKEHFKQQMQQSGQPDGKKPGSRGLDSKQVKDIKPQQSMSVEEGFDNWESDNIAASLGMINNYHTRRTDHNTGEDHDIKTMVSKDQLKPHLDQVLGYIASRLEYYRQNYGHGMIKEDYILETVLKFGTSSIELIKNYMAILYALKVLYPEDPDKRTELNRLFLGAADILNSTELHELVHKNRVSTS